MRSHRLKASTTKQQDQHVQRLLLWCREKNIDCDFLHVTPEISATARMRFSQRCEQLFTWYALALVRHGDAKCGPSSAKEYVLKIRGFLNDLHGFTMSNFHQHKKFTSTIEGMLVTNPQKRRQRGSTDRHHLLAIEEAVDLSLHSNRSMVALISVSTMLSCRTSDLIASKGQPWNKDLHTTVGDVTINAERMTVKIKTLKTVGRGVSGFQLKVAPAPSAVALKGNKLSSLLRQTLGVPPAVRLNPYFQVARLLQLAPPTAKLTSMPLFSQYCGNSHSYQDVYEFYKRAGKTIPSVKAANLTPHSGKRGGANLANRVGATKRVREAGGSWTRDSSMPDHYADVRIDQLENVVHQACEIASLPETNAHLQGFKAN